MKSIIRWERKKKLQLRKWRRRALLRLATKKMMSMKKLMTKYWTTITEVALYTYHIGF